MGNRENLAGRLPMSTTPKVWDLKARPYAIWVGLTGLLCIEMLALTLRFDGDSVRAGLPWSDLAKYSGAIARLGLTMVMATLLVASPRCYRDLKQNARRLASFTFSFPALLGNLLAFVAFYWLSISIFESDGPART